MYVQHIWTDKETITAEKLNNLEEGANAKSIPGPQGEPGPKGETGAKGEGLIGDPPILTILDENAEAVTIIRKVNEMIEALQARGITKGE